MPEGEEFPPYGPVPDPKRKPLVHRDPPQVERQPLPARPMTDLKPVRNPQVERRPLPARRMADLSPAGTDHNLLQSKSLGDAAKSTGRVNKSTEQANRFVYRPPSYEELKQQIDEEEADRLIPFDGYTKPPKAKKFGGHLRPKYLDINEYIDPYKTDDSEDAPFLDSAESIPPWTEHPDYVDEGEKVENKKRKKHKEKPIPGPIEGGRPIEGHAKIKFEKLNKPDLSQGKPAKIVDPESLSVIGALAELLKKNPDYDVMITPLVRPGSTQPLPKPASKFAVMKARFEAIRKVLQDKGIDPSRTVPGGDDGKQNADDGVNFAVYPRAPY